LVATERLPLWAHPELLKDTMLHLLVSAPGHILSARLDASSGLEAADQCALRWAKNARFQPLPQALPGTFPVLTPITAGQVVFRWGATHLPATNLPPGKS
jgi:TonB family protein